MSGKVITISRQYGSGGREIGARLAKQLNIPFYDKEIIALAAERSGISSELLENAELGNYIVRDFSFGAMAQPSLSDRAYLAQHALIKSLADQGPCVIVGRGAVGALKDSSPLLSVFVYADIDFRTRRAVEEYGDNPSKIKEHITAIDKKRAAYFKFYTGMSAQQINNYHLCIDSGVFGIKKAVDIIKSAYLTR